MSDKIERKKIIAGVVKAEKEKNSSYYLLERITDYENVFTRIFLEYFESSVGKEGWGIFFKQVHPLTPSFIVEVYLDNKKHFSIFQKTIQDNMPHEMKIILLIDAGDTKDFDEQ
ncbi:MAG TPA: hypothetical protein VFN30_09140 [Chitinophagaceae bacterium]|nr:hypothetical protein [Chitinophagaceae bacterium]